MIKHFRYLDIAVNDMEAYFYLNIISSCSQKDVCKTVIVIITQMFYRKTNTSRYCAKNSRLFVDSLKNKVIKIKKRRKHL